MRYHRNFNARLMLPILDKSGIFIIENFDNAMQIICFLVADALHIILAIANLWRQKFDKDIISNAIGGGYWRYVY